MSRSSRVLALAAASAMLLAGCARPGTPGAQPLHLDGYPVVRTLDENGKPVTVTILKGVEPITGTLDTGFTDPPAPIVIAPGAHAGMMIAWRNTYDNTTHLPVTIALVSVAPAPGDRARLLRIEDGLTIGSTGRIAVSPWRHVPTPVATTTAPPAVRLTISVPAAA